MTEWLNYSGSEHWFTNIHFKEWTSLISIQRMNSIWDQELAFKGCLCVWEGGLLNQPRTIWWERPQNAKSVIKTSSLCRWGGCFSQWRDPWHKLLMYPAIRTEATSNRQKLVTANTNQRHLGQWRGDEYKRRWVNTNWSAECVPGADTQPQARCNTSRVKISPAGETSINYIYH